MTDIVDVPLAPPDALRFRRRLGPARALRQLWGARELVVTLTERDFRSRYKQTILGVGWAVVTPVLLMLAFTVFFRRVAQVDTGGAPYPLYAYLGLLPWTFFSASLSQGALSLLNNHALLNKVACPREVFPLASVATAALDTLIAVSALAVLFVVYGTAPRATSVWVPMLLTVQVAFAVGVALLFSVVLIYFRDLRHLLPLLLQLGLFATPVAYGLDAIPADLRGLYSLVNPLAPVIDGYRRTVLLGLPPDLGLLALGALGAAVLLVGSYALFKRLEPGIADAG